MSIPAKQIGWSQTAILLWKIAKELEKANGIAGVVVTTTTTTTAP